MLMVVLTAISVIIYYLKSPSSSSSWSLGNGQSPSVTINGDQVKIENYRDIDWVKLDKIPADSIHERKQIELQGYRTLSFPLSDIQTLKVAVSHFSAISGIAHLFIIFELKDKTVVGLSVEARKEQGEDYSLVGGLTAKFEVIYVLASHNDLVGLRQMRDEDVFIYPIKATPEEVQALFKVAADRTNQLHKEPELYHLFFKNCTTEIVSLVNQLSDQKYPWFVQHLAPGDAGKALYDLNMIDIKTDSFVELQKLTLYKP